MSASKNIKLALLAALLLAPSFVSAQQNNGLAVGAGGYYNRIWKDVEKASTKKTYGSNSYNFFVWLDYKYLNLQVDFDFIKSKLPWVQVYNSSGAAVSDDLAASGFGFSAFGRYPFQLSQLTLSPMVGLYYKLYSKKDGDIHESLKYLNSLWLKFGGGLDYPISQSLAFKVFILGGYQVYSKYDKEMKDNHVWKESSTWSLDVKIGVGYQF